MDRHNNEIGIGLGKNAKTFDDVVSGAQRTIEESRSGDSPKGKGTAWLDRGQWQKNPKDGQGKELPEDGWNWGDGFDWTGKTVKEPYEYPYGGEEHKQQPSELKFPETDGVIDSLKPFPSSQTPESQEPPADDDAEAATPRQGKPNRRSPPSAQSDPADPLAGLPRLDGVEYQTIAATNGRTCITASGNVRDKRVFLLEAGFRWNGNRKLWWRYAA